MTANLLDFDLEGLAAFCASLGEKKFRATQLFRWIHQKGARDFTQMSDLAKSLRDKLQGSARIEGLPVITQHESADGTIKWLFDVGEGNAVEAVFIPEDELRDKLVPLNRKYPIAELLDACKRYLVHAPRDFITFEYCMLDAVNDQPEHARELVQLVRHHGGTGVPCKLNLIPFNPFPASGLVRSPQQRVQAFAKILSDAGIVTTVRKTRGDDIDAACGQPAGDVKDRTRVDRRIAQQRTVMLRQVPADSTKEG